MGDGHQGKGEGAGLDTGEIHCHKTESGRTHDRLDLVSQRGRGGAGNVVGQQLDAGDLTVMTHPAVREPQRTQSRLRCLDLGQLLGRDLLEVRDPRGEAGRCGLVGTGQLEGSGDAAHGSLVEACIREWSKDLVVGCCT